ncbi:maltase 1-like isoform X1 [Belonocnema kinseyi]|uniref:maltase 1-like isoform X1 n=1 Tax=Belonocnema kinseyi TaxID=2817044 RepID=UPI00143D4628|nr:maltase 1-like isoform X1 [Belonocnema kinseyi]
MSHLCRVFAFLCLFGIGASEIQNKGWWKNTVFYQIYPWSFMDSDNDGVGDLNGITSKLEHFRDAGVGAIWLSPIYKSPMVDFGYDIQDFRAIDERFGTLDDFTTLTKAAKQLGIKVILDLVPNHTSDKHEWFQQSLAGNETYNGYYIWKPSKLEGDPPNNWISVFSGPAWTYNEEKKLWYFHQFEYRQPDLNYANPKVKMEMEEVIKFWLDKGVDGFRVDAVPHLFEDDGLKDEPRSNVPDATDRDYTYLNHIYTKDDQRTYDLVQSWRKVLDDWADEHNETEKVMMTEAYTDLDNTVKFYKYGAHVPFNFKFITDVTVFSKPTDFKKLIETWINNMPEDSSANWVMGNHDRPRTESRYPGRGDQMTMLAMILPGVAVTYNGEEIGMVDKSDISWEDTQDPQGCNAGKDKYKLNSRDPNRTPFQWDNSLNAGFSNGTPWLPVHYNYNEINLKREKETKNSHYKVYQALTTLRNNSHALRDGSLNVTILNDTILIVRRDHKDETILLLINFLDAQDQIVNLRSVVSNADKTDNILLLAGSNLPSIDWGEPVDLLKVKLPAKSSLVLSSKPKVEPVDGGGASAISPIKIVLAVCLIIVFHLL